MMNSSAETLFCRPFSSILIRLAKASSMISPTVFGFRGRPLGLRCSPAESVRPWAASHSRFHNPSIAEVERLAHRRRSSLDSRGDARG